MHSRHVVLLVICLLVARIVPLAAQSEQAPPFNAGALKASWQVVENNYQGKAQFLSAFTLVNTGRKALPAQGWRLYFNFVRSVVPGDVGNGITAAHVNGDLYVLSPGAGFKGLPAGDSIQVRLTGDAWAVNFTDAPDGLYLVWEQDASKGYPIGGYSIRPSTEPRQYLRFPEDKTGLITPADIYTQNKQTEDIPAGQLPLVFPTPQEAKAGTGTFALEAGVRIDAAPGFAKEAAYLARELEALLGRKTAGGSGVITLQTAAGMAPESYTLEVSADRITIAAADGAGIFYGIQSLRSMLPPAAWAGKQKRIEVPAIQVKDGPRFGYRAFMLDVARNFHSKQDVLRLLDVMASYKLNTLHFHLNDDEGWRLEIPSLPELAQVGGRRGHGVDEKQFLQPAYGSGPSVNNPAGSGYYTRQDYIEILRYATDRHIRVIPEIETPGHARAAIKAMDARYDRLLQQGRRQEAEAYLLRDPEDQSQYRSVQNWNDNVINPAMPGVYRFLDKVVEEMQAMYAAAGAPLETVHMGGDEVPAGVWEKSPAIKALMERDSTVREVNDVWYYYYGKVHQLLQKRGLQLYGWEEMGMRKTTVDGRGIGIPNPDFVNKQFRVDVWNNIMGGGAEDLAYRLANANYKVVLSGVSNFYFDMACMKAFEEPGFYWGGFVDVDKPFYFIPFDYYKNAKVDALGNPLSPAVFTGKDRLTAYGAGNIVGIQGLLWSETVKNSARMEYMILPKLLGLAERAWARDPDWAQEKDTARSEALYRQAWSVFANVLGKRELPRLDYFNGGYQYRIPTAGAVVENGAVHANVQLPGLVIRYTSNGREPDMKSKVYTAPVTEKGTIKLRVFDTRGRGSRTVQVENR